MEQALNTIDRTRMFDSQLAIEGNTHLDRVASEPVVVPGPSFHPSHQLENKYQHNTENEVEAKRVISTHHCCPLIQLHPNYLTVPPQKQPSTETEPSQIQVERAT